MNRLEIRMGGLTQLLRSRELGLGELAGQYSDFLGQDEALYDLLVDFEWIRPAANSLQGASTNGSWLMLERQLGRRFADLPDREDWIRQRLEDASPFLSHSAFVECLRDCEHSKNGQQLVEVSYSGAWFLDRAATRARVFVTGDGLENDISQLDGFYRYLISSVLARRRGTLLHAAGVVEGDAAFLFVGPSGSGKTTIAYRAREMGWAVLADDAVIVRDMGPGGLRAFPTPWNAQYAPWSGDFGRSLESGAIQAIFFIEPGEFDQRVRQRPVVSTARLVEGTYPLLRGAEVADSDRMFGLLARLSQRVPCYALSFTRHCGFLEEIRGNLESEGER